MICIFCKQSLKNATSLRKHYQDIHPDCKPYICECGISFGYKSTLLRHQKNCLKLSSVQNSKHIPRDINFKSSKIPNKDIQTDLNLSSSEYPNKKFKQEERTSIDITGKSQEVSVKMTETSINSEFRKNDDKIFISPIDYRNADMMKCKDFEHWLFVYKYLTKETKDTPLAESVMKNVILFTTSLIKQNNPLLFIENDVVTFSEELDFFVDVQLKQVNHSTVTQRLRYIRWYICYSVSVFDCCGKILEELDNTIADMQSVSTNKIVNSNLLNILNPYELVKVSNSVVETLCEIQLKHIDPFIKQFFENPSSTNRGELVKFGNVFMKCWLELSIRFTNTPLRIQTTTGLMLPSTNTCEFISQLAIGSKQIERVIYNDKMGNHKQIVSIPLDSILSGYLLFYITYCRPNPDSLLVFQSVQGCEWKKASKDLKQFLTTYGINCDIICPNGRFIHASRNMGIACFSVLCNFDISKIRNYCTLLRHQLIHVEHIYSPWMKVMQSKIAGEDILKLRGFPVSNNENSVPIKNMLIPNGIVLAGFRLLFSQYCSDTNSVVIIRSRHIATQTEVDHRFASNNKTQNTIDNLLDDRLPICKHCGNTFVVLGPIGLSRSKNFGKYFTQCLQCHGKTNCTSSQYFQLGFKPLQSSKSAVPRNLSDIKAYISSTTGLMI